ncbi:MAG: PilZ domain-containing protein [Rubrivivax sp.]|jgi:hypothetical protein
MSKESADQRRHERVSFFLVPREREQIPVWVFAPPGVDGHRGVVLNISEGGAQVLTEASRILDQDTYELRLLLQAASDSGEGPSCAVRRAWSRELNALGMIHGLEFQNPSAAFMHALTRSPLSVEGGDAVRCILTAHAPT